MIVIYVCLGIQIVFILWLVWKILQAPDAYGDDDTYDDGTGIHYGVKK